MELGYGVNNLINTPLWDLIKKNINNIDHKWENATVSDSNDRKNVRKCKISWLIDGYLRTQLFHSINLYNKENWNYDLDGMESLQYGIYSDGGHYDWHVDESRENEVNCKIIRRKLSMTIWLNDPDEYEGGEFDIETKSPLEEIRYDTLKLSKGSIVIFPSNKVWHRVRPVTSGERKSLVGWFSGPAFR